MKNYILLSVALGLTACASSSPSPETMGEFRKAQTNLDVCLLNEIGRIDDGKTDQYLLARVVANKCEYTMLTEAKRLQDLDADEYFTKGFLSGYTDKREVIDRALELSMAVRQGLIRPIKKIKK